MGGKDLIPQELIETKIFLVRGKKVMLDRELAVLYGVQTKILNYAGQKEFQKVSHDFMFQLTEEEVGELLRSQFVTLKRGQSSFEWKRFGALASLKVRNS
jgi:hypothetical protein